MERQDFEDSWKQAFDKAEIPPSGNVWTNIELDLERANGSKLKKRLIIYQLLAAASLIFTLGLGAGVFIMKNSYEDAAKQLATQNIKGEKAKGVVPSDKEETPSADQKASQQSIATLNRADDKTSTIVSKKTKSNLNTKSGDQTSNDSDSPSVDGSSIAVNPTENSANEILEGNQEMVSVNSANAVLPSIVETREIKLALPAQKKETVEVDPVQLMLARLDQREREVREVEQSKKEKTQINERLWTSVGFAAGSFNAINAGVSNQQQDRNAFLQNSSATSVANNEAKASGVSYSVGANIGTKLSDRWVFQGGVNYLTQSSDYTTRTALIASEQPEAMSFRPPSVNELDKISSSAIPSEEKLVSTAPYNVNNNLRYLSIPMQAGYMVINKGFGLQLNAGVATDIFLQNTVSADGGNLDKVIEGVRENSTYRSMNFSGLAGTEVSYRFSKNYRVALNPGVRYPFNNIYRSGVGVKSTPITFDIGLRFRYIFH